MQASSDAVAGRAQPHPLVVTAALCVMAAGAALAAFPPIGWWPLAVLSPGLLGVAALGAATTRRGMWLSAVSFFFAWLLLQRWMIDVTGLGWPVLAAYMSIYQAVFVWLLRWLHRRRITASLPLAIVIPVTWVALEFVRGDLWMDGYPWFLIGHPLVEWPVLAQSADLLGHYITCFIAASIGGVCAEWWMVGESRSRLRAALFGTAFVSVLLAADIAYGLYRVNQTTHLVPGPRLLAIQTNLPQDNKNSWTPEQQVEDVRRFIELTRTAFAAEGAQADLILWPETMVPGLGLEPENIVFQRENNLQQEPWLEVMLALHREIGRPLLVGNSVKTGLGLERDDAGLRYTWEHSYNSAYLVEGEPPFQRYDKLFLTPFGETMPYISKWEWLERQLLDLGAQGMTFDLEPGERARRITVTTRDGDLELATPICFEDAVARVMRRLIWSDGEKAADLIINLSNDGWFGSFDGGRLQHVQIARFRCIENRLPMVRSVNTGLSVHIDSNGLIMGKAANSEGEAGVMQQEGWLLAEVKLDDRTTLYASIGDVLPWMCLTVTAAAIALGWFNGRNVRSDQ